MANRAGRGEVTAGGTRVHAARAGSWAFLLGVPLLIALVGVLAPPELWWPLLTLLLVVVIAAIGVGPLVLRPRRRAPWLLLLAAGVSFLVGVALRPAELGVAGTMPVPATLVALLGYGFAVGAVRSFLRDHADHDRGSFLDALLVSGGAAAPIGVFLVLPVIDLAGTQEPGTIVAAAFPVIDILLIHLLARLGFAMPTRPTAWVFLTFGALLLLLGDVTWGLVAAGFADQQVAAIDSMYLLALGAVAAGALHPSMRQLTIPTVRRTQPLRSGRLLVVGAAVAAPVVVIATVELDRPGTRAVVAASIALSVGAAIARSRLAVAQHSANEQHLGYMATHDALTRLPNRVQALEHIDVGLRRTPAPRHAVGLLVVDLDHFKLVNDTWGHPVGDELLVAAADRLAANLGPEQLVARMSSDVFLVVLGSTDTAAATALAEHLVQHFAAPFQLSVGEVTINVSIGLAVAGAHDPTGAEQPGAGDDARWPAGRDRDELLRDADVAMYHAKHHGRNRYAVFDASMRHRMTRRHLLDRDLRRALRRGDFTVHYQPIVGLGDRKLMGYEALLRWEHADGTVTPPEEFVPVLEETDLVVEVGHFVLSEAVPQLGRWHAAGHEVYVSVNVAARQLRGGLLVEQVGELLERQGVASRHLLLELTESLLIEESPAVRETMAGLTLLGVGIALDDFGTGHSSLQYLTRFPVTAVKIDRMFVHGLRDDVDNPAIVQAVVGMSHALGLTVIAEGVETREQLEALATLGCDAYQGFYDARPASAAELDRVRLGARRVPDRRLQATAVAQDD